jgi:hypothetical protein
MKNTPAYNYVSKCHDRAFREGGVAIGIDRILTFRDLGYLLPAQLNEALKMLFI